MSATTRALDEAVERNVESARVFFREAAERRYNRTKRLYDALSSSVYAFEDDALATLQHLGDSEMAAGLFLEANIDLINKLGMLTKETDVIAGIFSSSWFTKFVSSHLEFLDAVFPRVTRSGLESLLGSPEAATAYLRSNPLPYATVLPESRNDCVRFLVMRDKTLLAELS